MAWRGAMRARGEAARSAPAKEPSASARKLRIVLYALRCAAKRMRRAARSVLLRAYNATKKGRQQNPQCARCAIQTRMMAGGERPRAARAPCAVAQQSRSVQQLYMRAAYRGCARYAFQQAKEKEKECMQLVGFAMEAKE